MSSAVPSANREQMQVQSVQMPSYQIFNGMINRQMVQVSCRTTVDRSKPASATGPMPKVENCYQRTTQNKVVKVTKVTIGNHVITLLDNISINPPETDLEQHKDDNINQPFISIRSSVSRKQLVKKNMKLPLFVRNLLKHFKQFIRAQHSELVSLLDQILSGEPNEKNIRLAIKSHQELKQAFLQFKAKLSQLSVKKRTKMLITRWACEMNEQKGTDSEPEIKVDEN